MGVFGGKVPVSMVVQNYVEEGVHRRMVVVVDNQKSAHHSRHLDMLLGMALGYSILVEVVAKMVDQILVAPPIFDSPILDTCSHCNLLFLQHNCNQTHSQRGESSW
ncbi:hypothetical protein AHAS_Ahas05G0050600 [Arachis hypogaea]